jgi:membrane protein
VYGPRASRDRCHHCRDPRAGGRHPDRRLRHGRPLGREKQALTPPSGHKTAAARGRLGPAFAVGDLKRAFKRFQEDHVTDHAAALTYYSLLSLFPALLFGVAVLGVFGQQALVDQAADYLKQVGAPPETVDAVTKALGSAIDMRKTALTALVIGLGTALYGASGAFGAAGRALNHIWRIEEGRGFVRRKLQDLAWTLILVALVLITFVLIFLGGGLAEDALGKIGLGHNAAEIWQYIRWPGALLAATAIYAIVYYAAPNMEIRTWRFITPGAAFGVLLWILASAGFFVYVSGFSNYGATYGAFSAVVVLLIWLWLTNTVLLFGAELNYVVDRRRTPGLAPDYDGPLMPPKGPPDE